MNLYPAIDLKGGACVRLVRGDMGQATIFNDDPAAQARAFAAAGFSRLHIVDLDGAFSGRPVNRAAVEAAIAATNLKVQLGGGIRDLRTIEAWLEAGVARVILGTVALRAPQLVREAARLFPGRILVGIDARGGRVAVEGWAETSEVEAAALARQFEDAGVAGIVHTDIERDGAMAGIDTEAIRHFVAALSLPVIVAGGVTSLVDIAALKGLALPNLDGVISGRALYDGRIDPARALALLAA